MTNRRTNEDRRCQQLSRLQADTFGTFEATGSEAFVKLVATSDWHVDRSTIGVRRFDEVVSAIRQSVEHAVASRADAYLFLGDLADPDSDDTIPAIALLIETALSLSEEGIPFFAVAGNHDCLDSGTGSTCLTPLAAVAKSNPLVYAAERPELFQLSKRLALVCLPFAPVSHAYDPDKEARRLMTAARNMGLRAIVASHLSIPGIIPGEETIDMPRGRETVYPFESTRDAIVRLSGHYHRQQVFDPQDGGPPIYVIGSPARFAFGHDEANEPAFLVLDVEG